MDLAAQVEKLKEVEMTLRLKSAHEMADDLFDLADEVREVINEIEASEET